MDGVAYLHKAQDVRKRILKATRITARIIMNKIEKHSYRGYEWDSDTELSKKLNKSSSYVGIIKRNILTGLTRR